MAYNTFKAIARFGELNSPNSMHGTQFIAKELWPPKHKMPWQLFSLSRAPLSVLCMLKIAKLWTSIKRKIPINPGTIACWNSPTICTGLGWVTTVESNFKNTHTHLHTQKNGSNSTKRLWILYNINYGYFRWQRFDYVDKTNHFALYFVLSTPLKASLVRIKTTSSMCNAQSYWFWFGP